MIEDIVKKYDLLPTGITSNDGIKKHNYLGHYGVSVTLYEDKAFSFSWSDQESIFTLNCPVCSPWDNVDHFDGMYRKFVHKVHKLIF